ncbi:MAG: tRNA-guanine transglycosylase [Theionarchaea archaeon]|nr:tRNA-guanine transglycosylase [Theionarchaea archaeon]MBU7038690.1 tRNA-guanine transglycosylase [Theionarchaea archaeon]
MPDIVTNHGIIKTPALIPVVAASYGIWDKWIGGDYVAPWELSQGVILSLYHILKYPYRDRILKEGIHDVLRTRNPVYIDSGGFQYMKKGVELEPVEVLQYQERMGCDIGITFDFPILPDIDDVEKEARLERSIASANIMLQQKKTDMQLYGAIHGSNPREITDYMQKLDSGFSGYGIGSLVPRKNHLGHLVDMIHEVRQQTEKPVHCFGITGFPALFALSYLGVDTFDSWAYVVAAAFKEFVHPVTLSRVKNIKRVDSLPPCECAICQQYTHEDMIKADSDSEIILALHNLNIFLYEMKMIRESTRENNLEDYIEKRSQTTNKKVRQAFRIARDKLVQSTS